MEQGELQTHNEQQEDNSSNIHIQAATHPFFIFEVDTPYGWNSETLERLQQSKPKFIAIDGSAAHGQDNPLAVILEDSLTLHPEAIDPSYEQIHFVRGDFVDIAKPLHFLTSDPQENQAIEAVNDWISKETPKKIGKYSLGSIVLGIALFTAGQITKANIRTEAQQATNVSPNQETSKGLTRRQFLGKALGFTGAAMLALGSSGLAMRHVNIAASKTRSNESMDQLANLASKLDVLQAYDWWMDGRSAILIAKTQDSIIQSDEPPDSRAEIILGNTHYKYSQELLKDKSRRDNAIHIFAENVIKECAPLFSKLKLSPDERANAVRLLLSNVAITDMLTVKKPDYETNKSRFSIKSFMSPQIMEATKNLWPPENNPKGS